MRTLIEYAIQFFDKYLKFPKISISDAIEIVIIAFLVYQIMLWIKRTRAWSLFKGILVVIVFMLIATFFNLTTILWLADKTLSVGIIAVVIIFQPELRKVLEELGKNNPITNIFSIERHNVNERFSDETIEELISAALEMAKQKTGALIVIEGSLALDEYVNTGIEIDSAISSQLLINIFEHNTPLHDGAVIISGNRIVAATCYLPLSENMELSKRLGTRHRAGVGISEVTDSLTIIVSEETGKVSIAIGGELMSNIDTSTLRSELIVAQNKIVDKKKFKFFKGRGQKNVGKTEENAKNNKDSID